tara:strand:+ start:301 stop:1050 length:750 start_codon:yes stop_codon:yes gene_type:complete
MKRKKSKFEKWFSFSRHKRRFGASNVVEDMNGNDLLAMENTLIDEAELQYTHGSEVSIEAHIDNLKKEFVGQSQLCHYLASLLVLIRREVDVEKNFSNLEALWEMSGDFLLTSLNTRWLIAVADTYADYSKNPTERACALAVTSLVNTIKLCETEKLITDNEGVDPENMKKYDLQNNRYPLWDGTSAFAVGTDDTLRNFRWRLDDFVSKEGASIVTAKIFETVFSRLQDNNNIYKRFRDCHHRNRTEWW